MKIVLLIAAGILGSLFAGRLLPPGMEALMTEAGLALPDTDWHVARLYDFVRDLGASLLVAKYSRYVVDLNRPLEITVNGRTRTYRVEPSVETLLEDARRRADRLHPFWAELALETGRR